MTWADLPEAVRDRVQDHTGRVTGSRPAGGDRSDITAILDTDAGPVFLKGAATPRYVRALRNEAAVVPCVAGIAPALLWRVETEGWTIVGFEFVDGRHADYSPGSSDLDLLRAALTRLQQVPCPEQVTAGVERQYGGLRAIAGDGLLHTDLHSENVLISAGHACIVDWAWACKGAPWAELAMLAFRLMAAGRTIETAEAWGRGFPSWEDGEALAVFTEANAQTWDRAAQRDPQDWKARAARIARQWADHRNTRRL